MKMRLGIVSYTSMILVIILLHTIVTAQNKGASMLVAVITMLAIMLATVRALKNKKMDISDKKMIPLSLVMVIVSYLCFLYAPYFLGLTVVSISFAVSYKHFMQTLKVAVAKQEGI